MANVIVPIPLFDKQGEVQDFAVVDKVDALLRERHWTLTHDGYATTSERGESVRMHRLILGLTVGDGVIVDHINRNHLDNRRRNLRRVTAAENVQNTFGRRGRRSKYRNVYFSNGRWVVYASLNYRQVYIGSFGTEDEAGAAARSWRLANMSGAVD